MSPDVIWVVIIIAAIACAALVFAMGVWRGRQVNLHDVRNGLDSLSRSQESLHQQLSEQLRSQEKELGRTLYERLDAVTARVGESLSKNAEKNESQLSSLCERLAVIDAAQSTITNLSKQVVDLQDILSNKQARGRFGEERLEDIIRDQLPLDYHDFQAVLSNGKRPDCLLKIPPPTGPVVIDAKFPLEAYRGLISPHVDPVAYKDHCKAFTANIKRHINAIAEKYIISGETAEFALMFVPSEAIYSEIHAHHPILAEEARKKRVLIVSPTTFWAVIGTMRAIIRDQRMREQAGRIQKEVSILLDDVRRIDERIGRLRKHFNQADTVIDEIETSRKKIDHRGQKIVSLDVESPASLSVGDVVDFQHEGPHEEDSQTDMISAGR